MAEIKKLSPIAFAKIASPDMLDFAPEEATALYVFEGGVAYERPNTGGYGSVFTGPSVYGYFIETEQPEFANESEMLASFESDMNAVNGATV